MFIIIGFNLFTYTKVKKEKNIWPKILHPRCLTNGLSMKMGTTVVDTKQRCFTMCSYSVIKSVLWTTEHLDHIDISKKCCKKWCDDVAILKCSRHSTDANVRITMTTEIPSRGRSYRINNILQNPLNNEKTWATTEGSGQHSPSLMSLIIILESMAGAQTRPHEWGVWSISELVPLLITRQYWNNADVAILT